MDAGAACWPAGGLQWNGGGSQVGHALQLARWQNPSSSTQHHAVRYTVSVHWAKLWTVQVS